jgi:hypothetical protein
MKNITTSIVGATLAVARGGGATSIGATLAVARGGGAVALEGR